MHTKFSHSLSLHGYITTRRSSPNHVVRVSLGSTRGAVSGFVSAIDLGMTNLNAAFPVGNSGIFLIACLVVDCSIISIPGVTGQTTTYKEAISSKNDIGLHQAAVVKGDAELRINMNCAMAWKQLHGVPHPLIHRGHSLQLLMKGSSVDKMPRVRPPCVRLSQVKIFENMAIMGELDIARHEARSKRLGIDAPLAQDAAGIGAEVNSGTRVVVEAGLV